MLKFLPLTLQEMALIKPFLPFSSTRTCDNTAGGIFMWRDFFHTEYAIKENTLFFKVRYLSGKTAFTVPIGENTDTAFLKLEAYCEKEGDPLIFCTVTEQDLSLLSNRYRLDIKEERDWFDYLYAAEDLAAFAGRRYHGQRNHVNAFIRDTAAFSFESITKDIMGEVQAFFCSYEANSSEKSALFDEEQQKVAEVLSHFDTYGMQGLVLRVDGKIEAFSVWEILGDTAYVHVEKANSRKRGAYPMMVRETAKRVLENGVPYMNREEDVGDEGLRTAKLALHPIALLKKYTVTVLEKK